MNLDMKPHIAKIELFLLVALLPFSIGCRAINRFGDNSQGINARRLSGQGFQAMHEGDWDSAENLFLQALDLSDSDDRARWGLAESYWQRGEQTAAVQQMEQAVELSAGDPKLVQRLGRMYLELGRIEEATHHSIWALDLDRYSAQAWSLRGDCLRASQEPDQALAAYHRALAIQPDFAQAQIETAEIYLSQSRHDRVVATLDRVQDERGLRESPAKVDLLRGIAMQELGRFEDAKRCFARASEKAPDDATPFLRLAELALIQGRKGDAALAVQQAKERQVSSTDEANWIAQLEQQQTRIAAVPNRSTR